MYGMGWGSQAALFLPLVLMDWGVGCHRKVCLLTSLQPNQPLPEVEQPGDESIDVELLSTHCMGIWTGQMDKEISWHAAPQA